MSNYLKVEAQEAIKHLLKTGRSQRWIARELDVHRRTVKRYAKELSGAKCSDAPPGSKCTISRTGKVGRPSHCEAHRARIEKQLDLGLSAQRIYQDLKVECGFRGSYASVQRFVKKLKEEQPARIWRMECEPGEEAQVDYGEMRSPVFLYAIELWLAFKKWLNTFHKHLTNPQFELWLAFKKWLNTFDQVMDDFAKGLWLAFKKWLNTFQSI